MLYGCGLIIFSYHNGISLAGEEVETRIGAACQSKRRENFPDENHRIEYCLYCRPEYVPIGRLPEHATKLIFLAGTVKVASIQKGAQDNIIRPSWLLDCVKQSHVDAGLPNLPLPLEPRYVSRMSSNDMLVIDEFFKAYVLLQR